jgi:carboxypeptidase C (cathepsin A)
MKFFFGCVAFLASVASGAPAADEIANLPGWPKPLPSKHYSGFLDVKTETRVHYWFVESEGDPATDPIVIWFNGGPPCSALVGAFGEVGPFQINYGTELGNKALYENPGRWNKKANLLFYENPPGRAVLRWSW